VFSGYVEDLHLQTSLGFGTQQRSIRSLNAEPRSQQVGDRFVPRLLAGLGGPCTNFSIKLKGRGDDSGQDVAGVLGGSVLASVKVCLKRHPSFW